MTIKIYEVAGTPVKIGRGSPQGSVLGCLLYCVTTQCLTKQLRGAEGAGDAAEQGAEAFLYVDDTTLFDSVPVDNEARHITVNRTEAAFDGLQVGADFDALTGRAKAIGMKINAKKTQRLTSSSSLASLSGRSLAPGPMLTP